MHIISVNIVDKNSVPMYGVFIPQPSDCRINKSRQYCPVMDQQFVILMQLRIYEMDTSGNIKQIFHRGPPKVAEINTIHGIKNPEFIDFLKVVYKFTMSQS